MRIKPDQLQQSAEQPLLPVYLVTGDEPLLVQEAMDILRQAARKQGYLERTVLEVDRHFDWQTLTDEAATLSLFAERKLSELRLGSTKPGVPGSKALIAYCEKLPEDTLLFIECGKLDGSTLKSKWVQAIEKCGALIQIWPIALNEMPRWIAQRARHAGLNMEHECVDILANRLEGNLLAAKQELEKLKLLHGDTHITTEMISDEVADSARYDVFNLMEECINGHTKHAVKILNHLKIEGLETTRVLWAVSREIRLLGALALAISKAQPEAPIFSKYRVLPRRQAAIKHAAKRLPPSAFNEMLKTCKHVDDCIKGIAKDSDPWELMMDMVVQLGTGKTLT